MHRNLLWGAALAAAISAPLAAHAQDPELAKLRDEIRQMRDAYERRIEALEKRLQETETRAAASKESAKSETPAAAAQASSRPAGEGAFNPAVSLILNGTLSNLKRDPETYRISG